MTTLIALIRNGDIIPTYDQPFDPSRTDEEVYNHITELNCSNNNLTVLPSLPSCTELECSDNKLTTLPSLPLCPKKLYSVKNIFEPCVQKLPRYNYINHTGEPSTLVCYSMIRKSSL
jgi:Leucine-rich repeat (LRR) protein